MTQQWSPSGPAPEGAPAQFPAWPSQPISEAPAAADPAHREKSSPPRETRSHAGDYRIVPRYAADLAVDWRKLSFALQLGVGWAAGLALCGLLAKDADEWAILAGVALGLLWTAVCFNWLIGGIGRLVTLQLEGRRYSRADAWHFVRSHWLAVAFGNCIPILGIGGISLIFVLLVRQLGAVPGIGQTLGALMIVPTFFYCLGALAIVLNSYMLPCIMGIENVGLRQAIRLVLDFAAKPYQAAQFLHDYLRVLGSAAAMAILSGILAVGVLVLTLFICLPDFTVILQGGLSGLIANLSGNLIFYSWLVYVVVYLTCGFAIMYYKAKQGGDAVAFLPIP